MLSLQDSGRAVLEMGLGSRFGKMAQSILGSGERTKLMVKVNLYMLMEMSMMATGQMIRQME